MAFKLHLWSVTSYWTCGPACCKCWLLLPASPSCFLHRSAMFFYLPYWSFQKPKNGCAFRNLILRSGLTILKAIKEVLDATWEVQETITFNYFSLQQGNGPIGKNKGYYKRINGTWTIQTSFMPQLTHYPLSFIKQLM